MKSSPEQRHEKEQFDKNILMAFNRSVTEDISDRVHNALMQNHEINAQIRMDKETPKF